jgi:two-component system OmpR family response regulator
MNPGVRNIASGAGFGAPSTGTGAMARTERTDTTPAALSAGNLLVVDDEPTVRELLPAALRYAGFTVVSAATGAEALATALHEPPDLVLLDVMLPDMDGFEVIRRLREQPRPAAGPHGGSGGHIPVLFLTARDTTQDKINGLHLGGDDYVTKPFDLQELIARIRAVLRRTSGDPNATLTVADLELDPEGHQVLRAGQPIRLSPTEFRLLHYLMANAGRTISKTQILDHVWQYDFGGDPSIVDTYISYLRRKIDASAPHKLIHTVHGIGYVIRGPKL